MDRRLSEGRAAGRVVLGLALATVLLAGGAEGASGAGLELDLNLDFSLVARPARLLAQRALIWYHRTPPADRVTWGGLGACALLGLGVFLERVARLRRGRVVPHDFVTRLLDRLREGKLDGAKALDLCELNPSPAARVALGAVRRWDRPAADQERAVALVQRIEADRLRRHVATLRRVAALAPLLGLLGTLISAGRTLAALGTGTSGPTSALAWGPALATALSPLTVGVTLAILALVAYDGLVGRVEALAGALERLGAEIIDAIALATPTDPRPETTAHGRTPHSIRVEIPDIVDAG